jgi:L-iditol 2-dehydrogenase
VKALVKYAKGEGNLEIRDVDVPRPGSGEVLIQVAACGICGSDLHIFADEFPNNPPVIIGHELSGTIAEVGEGAGDLKTGERVVSELHIGSCGACRLCRTGSQHICPSKLPMGSKADGGFAEYVKVAGRLVHRIPDDVDLIEAALTEPIAICFHALVEMARINPGDTVAIFGPGPVGLISALVVKERGAKKVILAGTDKDEAVRLKAARSLPVDRIVNVQKEDVAAVVMKETRHLGADVVIEASGAPEAIRSAVDISARKGSIIAIGLTAHEEVPFQWNKAVIKETIMTMPFSSTWTSWEMALGFLQKRQSDLAKLITRRPLEEWKEAFDDLKACRAIKTLLTL